MTVPAQRKDPRGFDLFAYQRALEHSQLPTGHRHLLLVMAFTPVPGSDGVCSGPRFSYPRLALSTGYTERGARKALQAAEQAGWIQKIPAGRGRRNSYRLLIPAADLRNVDNPTHVEPTRELSSPPCPVDNPNPGTQFPTTPVLSSRDSGTQFPPIYPLSPLRLPSIIERVRAVLRKSCPQLQPDDDDLSRLLETLEARGVANPVGYLQRCGTDAARLLAELAEPPTAQPNPGLDQQPEPERDCEHGTPGGANLTSAGTPRCPECRVAARVLASRAFRPPVDGPHPTGQLKPLDALSGATA